MSYQRRFPEIPEKRPFTYKQLLCLLKCIIFSYLGRILKIYLILTWVIAQSYFTVFTNLFVESKKDFCHIFLNLKLGIY